MAWHRFHSGVCILTAPIQSGARPPHSKETPLLDQRPFDVIVIGGGAAGLFCAIEAGKRGRKVLVIEHADRVGKKIAISGGGRCNFTNTYQPRIVSLQSTLLQVSARPLQPPGFHQLVEQHGIAYHEKKLGQLFCDGSSQQIIECC